MSIYSAKQSNTSIMHQNGFDIKMGSGKGWYPFVLTYNADGFSSWSGFDADMSIVYNFGAFDASSRTSSLYDISSPLYSSFYGAYAVKKNGGELGFFSDGSINVQEILKAVEYDYTQLVMRNFGCSDPVFSIDELTMADDMDCAGSADWTRIDALMITSGAAHSYKSDKTAYLQYGPPLKHEGEDFAAIEMFGRVYAKYFKEYDCTIMLYVMAPNSEVVDLCDKHIFLNTRIE